MKSMVSIESRINSFWIVNILIIIICIIGWIELETPYMFLGFVYIFILWILSRNESGRIKINEKEQSLKIDFRLKNKTSTLKFNNIDSIRIENHKSYRHKFQEITISLNDGTSERIKFNGVKSGELLVFKEQIKGKKIKCEYLED